MNEWTITAAPAGHPEAARTITADAGSLPEALARALAEAGGEVPPGLPRFLPGYVLVQSSDDVKRDLEITCETCGAYICDAEPGDSLHTLALAAADHEHGFRPLEFWTLNPDDLWRPAVLGTWDPASGLVVTAAGQPSGSAATAAEARNRIKEAVDPAGAVYWQPDESVLVIFDCRDGTRDGTHACIGDWQQRFVNAGGHPVSYCTFGNHRLIGPAAGNGHRCGPGCAVTDDPAEPGSPAGAGPAGGVS